MSGAYTELEKAIFTTLMTYSNVHRGTGHNSIVTTSLFEYAREIILNYLQIDKNKYIIVFCSPFRLKIFKTQLKPSDYVILSSDDLSLPLGVRVIAIKKKKLQKSHAIYTGGGMIKHVTSKYVIWADLPEKFEAGTPSIVNIIGFAKALQIVKKLGLNFKEKQLITEKSLTDIFYQDDILQLSGKKLLNKLKNLLIGKSVRVPTEKGFQNFTNLDNAASTPTFLPIWDTYCTVLEQPKEIYLKIIKEVKKICAKFLNAPLEDYNIIFTSNTTESINIVAQCLSKLPKNSGESFVVNTIMEHHSNELPFRYINGINLIRMSVDDEGFIDINELERTLKDKDQVHIVAISGVSNVLGTRNDLKAIGQIVHKYGAKFLVDGAQLVAHHKTDIIEMNIDFLAFSGHKMYAPFGSGVLVVKKGLLTFDTKKMNEIKSSGEENVAGIAAIGKAILLLDKIGINNIEEYEKKFTRMALNGLRKIKNVEVFGIKNPNSTKFDKRGGIISFNLKNVPHNLAAKEIAENGGIGLRDGCFCAHMFVQQILKVQQIRILGARMTSIIFPEQTRMCLPGTLRISFGIGNIEDDINT
ncbi:MAG: aminotransferase class V-fold PLP-dependent enzyme, partial [Promethearchaeota archaeon]